MVQWSVRKLPSIPSYIQGFTLLELMTTVMIVGVLVAVAVPGYREYLARASFSEAATVLGTINQNQVKYYVENGSFVSTEPNPALVPGIDGVGNRGSFGQSTNWSLVGSPVATGSAVMFSYQSFAGQTEKTSSTPIVNSTQHSPNDDMDLIRSGRYNASLQTVPMKYYALHADDFRFDFELNRWNAVASECSDRCNGDEACLSVCSIIECVEACDPRDESCAAACRNPNGDPPVRSDGKCYGEYPLDPDCVCRGPGGMSQCGHSNGSLDPRIEEACVNGDAGLDPRDGSVLPCDDEDPPDEDPPPPPDGDIDPNDDDGPDDPDQDEDPEESVAENTCAPFGVSRPVHLGVQEGIANYSWVVSNAVGNQRNGDQCWLIFRISEVIGGKIQSTSFVQINYGQ